MIYLHVIKDAMIGNSVLRSAASIADVRAVVCLQMRRDIGSEIKRYVPYGIKPAGKLDYSLSENFMEYDGEQHHMQVKMKGTLFQFLHAFRAGLRRGYLGRV